MYRSSAAAAADDDDDDGNEYTNLSFTSASCCFLFIYSSLSISFSLPSLFHYTFIGSSYHTLRNQQKALTNPTSYPSGLNRGFPPSSDTSNAVGPNTGVEEVRSAAFAAYFNGNKDRKGDKKVLKAGYDDVRGVPPKGVKKAQRDWSYLDNLPDEASSIQKGHTDTGGHSMPTQHSHAVDHYDHEPNPALLSMCLLPSPLCIPMSGGDEYTNLCFCLSASCSFYSYTPHFLSPSPCLPHLTIHYIFPPLHCDDRDEV
jgi:hypothetical protein